MKLLSISQSRIISTCSADEYLDGRRHQTLDSQAKERTGAGTPPWQDLGGEWATDLCRVWTGRDGWATLALVMTVTPANGWADTSRAAVKPRRHRFETLQHVSRVLADWIQSCNHRRIAPKKTFVFYI
jgi:hypothetical protein